MSYHTSSTRKEKRGGGIKGFFKSITKSGQRNGGGERPVSPRAVLPSGDNQYAIAHDTRSSHHNGTAPPFMQRSPPKANSVSSASRVNEVNDTHHVTPPKLADANVVRWGIVLSRIPKLVAESTSVSTGSASPSGSASNSPTASSSNGGPSGGESGADGTGPADMTALLDSLRHMASKEYQAQILQYYTGSNFNHATVASSGMNNINILSNWEQRKVFKQCRRSLLLCWKFIIAQLNDEKTQKTMSPETRSTYYELLGLIAERVEFNLLVDPKETTKATGTTTSSNGTISRPPTASKARTSSQAGTTGYVSADSPPSTVSSMHSFDSTDNNATTTDESGNEGERDIYLYRCLLVATFKHVIENIDAANHKRRPFISLSESQFFAKVLAICFFRIPVVQRMILDGVFEAYRYKKWTKTTPGTSHNSSGGGQPGTPSHSYMQSRLNRRRSSSKPWNSMTFEGTLARWSEFEGQMLSEYNEEDNQSSENDVEGKLDYQDKLSESSSSESDNNYNGNPFAPPTRVVMDKYKRLNPTLFRWSRYSPYLGPYADCDVFRPHESTQAGWLNKLVYDGEFFASFMSSYVQHVEFVNIGDPVWYCLPGYPLLIRVSLLLVKEAAWQKWLAVRDTTDNIVTGSRGNQDDHDPVAFEVKSSRQVKTVLDTVVQLLKNSDVLESVVLGMFECTNVFNAKSVSVCLSRLEEWFSAAAERLGENAAGDISYRLPSTFHGYAIGTAVRIMLCSESFEILNRVLLFLYNRMDYFDGELRQSVLKAIVQRHMYLFLHWNSDVRHTYHHLLVYKIIRTNRYLLDSPIDQLLVGRFAMMHHEALLHGRDENTSGVGFDDSEGAFDEVDARPVLSAAEYNMLRLEQALWRAFDACLASICVQERRNARDANRKYQVELQAARSRAVAFQKLTVKSAGDDTDRTSSVNEGLPGHKASQEFDLLNEELNREPPYYLRYLPAEEVSSLDELRRLAQTVKYPAELQVYAASSLRGYSDLLKQYFYDLRARGTAEAPPLGFV